MFRTQALVAALLLAAAGLLAGLSREAARAHASGRFPERSRPAVERCVTCHAAAREDPGGAHAAAALGCTSCHLGNPLAFTKERAHEGLELEPGALDTVARTCGRAECHAREAARVATLPMTRADGIVAGDRLAFGAPARELERITEAVNGERDLHLRKLCAGCHLGTRRANRDDAIAGNGSGCAACHVPLKVPGAPRRHPPVDARVTEDRCFGCHSRSGRISLSYRGWAEVEPAQETPTHLRVPLPGGRAAVLLSPDVHAAAGMTCIDCHVHTELMGDGVVRRHGGEAVEVSCATCHGPNAPEGTWEKVEEAVEPITRAILKLRGETRSPAESVRLGARGTPLWNLRFGKLTPKAGGKPLAVKSTPRDAAHEMRGHERLSCSSCHAAWAPTCTSCHTTHDPKRTQWDFAAGRETEGAFVESSEGFGWAEPALAVKDGVEIVPAVPGMLLGPASHGADAPRVFGAFEPHTTGKAARTCASCHAAPQPFRPGDRGTRPGIRPLDEKEEARVLSVGRCLPCHGEAADPVWRDFASALRSRPAACLAAARH